MSTVTNEDERKVQEALGLSEQYRVSIEIPVKVTVRTSIDVNAVSSEDAEEQVKTLLKIQTPEQTLTNIGMDRGSHSTLERTTGLPNIRAREILKDEIKTSKVVNLTKERERQTATEEQYKEEADSSPSTAFYLPKKNPYGERELLAKLKKAHVIGEET